jgi:phenylpropionate dioxygenase-like ring-hydroxylating dioxygenase large terminal subunit
MPEDFDSSSYGLHPVHVRLVSGFIFISLAENPPDFTKVSEDYAPFLKHIKSQRQNLLIKRDINCVLIGNCSPKISGNVTIVDQLILNTVMPLSVLI